MNNIIAYTILLIIVMYVLKSNIEKFAIDIGNTTTPPASNPLDIVSTTISSIGNTTTQPPSNGIVDILSASIGNTPTPPAQPSTGGIFSAGNTTTPPALPMGGIFSAGNTTTQPNTGGILSGIIGDTTTTPPASSDDLEAKVAAFCKSVQ
jgi:hypothetical protein